MYVYNIIMSNVSGRCAIINIEQRKNRRLSMRVKNTVKRFDAMVELYREGKTDL